MNEYVYFRIQLGDFIYPRDLPAFNRTLLNALRPHGIPVLTDGNPTNTRDGNYAIQSESIFGHSDDYQYRDHAWSTAVENLSHTRAFETNADQAPIFLRMEIQERDNNALVVPELRHGTSSYKLVKKKFYDLVLNYRFPRQRLEQTSTARFDVQFEDNLKPLGTASVTVDSHVNSPTLPFTTKRYIEETSGKLGIASSTEPGQPESLLADISLQYRLGESPRFWTQIVLALLLLSLTGTLIGVDFSKIQPLTVRTIIDAAWPKLVLGVTQTGILYWLFWLIGKKIL